MHLTQPPHFLAESRNVKLEEKILKSSQKNCPVSFVLGRITSLFWPIPEQLPLQRKNIYPCDSQNPFETVTNGNKIC